MSQQTEGANKTFVADGSVAIAQYARVVVTAGVITAAGVTERGIGILQEPVLANSLTQHVPVRLFNAEGSFKMIAAGAVTLDALVYAAAAGKCDDTATTILLGKALEAASGSGSIIEVLPIREQAAPVQGIASGYKIARGTVTLDGSNPTPVATGLTTIVAATTSLKGTAAPGDDPSWLSHDYSGADGTLNIYAWKNTGGTDPTLVASTNATATIDWIAVGT